MVLHPAAANGTPSIPESSAPPASTSGLKLNAFRAVGGRDTQNGMFSNVTSGSKLHNAAKGETTDCARANRRVSDSQPRGRQRSAVWCPARQRCPLATRFQQWSAQCPSVSISNISTATVKRKRHWSFPNDSCAASRSANALPPLAPRTVSLVVFLAHGGKAQPLARKSRECATNRETRTSDNRDGGKTRGIACSGMSRMT